MHGMDGVAGAGPVGGEEASRLLGEELSGSIWQRRGAGRAGSSGGAGADRRKPSAWRTVDALLASDQPLDEDEQRRLLDEFQAIQLQSSRLWRRACGLCALSLAAFFSYATVDQHRHPWEQRYTGELRTVTSARAAEAMLLLQALALASSSFGLLRDLPKPGERERGCMPPSTQQRTALWLGVAGTLVAAAFWASRLWAMVAVHGWQLGAKLELSWLPAVPLAVALVCVHVSSMLGSNSKEISQLRSLMYDHKKV